jgi:hypothetical protein
MREFRDEAGIEWKVSLTPRGSDAVSREHLIPEAYREGWLVFESSTEKRRLAPVPADWETISPEALIALCAKASPQSPKAAEAKRAEAKPAEAKAADAKPAESKSATAKAAASAADPLRPQLQKAEKQLDETISEVCETPVASRLNTGELIRVEESLALAAEAAKEAVSLRRRLHADRERSGDIAGDDLSSVDTGRDRASR